MNFIPWYFKKKKVKYEDDLPYALQFYVIEKNPAGTQYCTFDVTFILYKVHGYQVKDQFIRSSISGEKYATKVEDDFILHIATAHRIPAEWIQRSVNAMNEYKEGCIQDKFYFILLVVFQD